MQAYLCCLVDRDGEYHAFCKIEATDVSEALRLAWNVIDKFPNCAGMSIFCGNVRVFTNVPKKKLRPLPLFIWG